MNAEQFSTLIVKVDYATQGNMKTEHVSKLVVKDVQDCTRNVHVDMGCASERIVQAEENMARVCELSELCDDCEMTYHWLELDQMCRDMANDLEGIQNWKGAKVIL